MNNLAVWKNNWKHQKEINVTLIDNRDQAIKLSSKPNFEQATIFDEKLIAVQVKKTFFLTNQSMWVKQFWIFRKHLMFYFHYNYIREKYGDKAELFFTDTYSLMYEIQTKDFYQEISKDIQKKFDTSDYPENHPSEIKTGISKKVIGKFKDEAKGYQIPHLHLYTRLIWT